MTTFTTQDREALEKGLDFFNELKKQDVSIEIEPIPFAGMVRLEDNEDRVGYYQQQAQILQAEVQRLRKKLRDLGEND